MLVTRIFLNIPHLSGEISYHPWRTVLSVSMALIVFLADDGDVDCPRC